MATKKTKYSPVPKQDKLEMKELKKADKQNVTKQVLSNILYWEGSPIVKSDVEVAQRLSQFFARCEETGEWPTVEKMSLALGTHSDKLYRWQHGKSLYPHMTDATVEMIKKAKQIIAAIDAEMAIQGKASTAAYIFRAKNWYGMKDQVETIISKNEDAVQTTEQLEKRYGNVVDVDYEVKKEEGGTGK